MVSGVDTPWVMTNADDAVMNAVTIGQGTVFPSPWPVNRMFLRTDLNAIFTNIGTLNSPIFSPVSGVTASIIDFAGPIAKIPLGYLRCDGAAVSRTTFANLFGVIDTIYGIGDGSTTFNLPNLETDNKFTSAADEDADLNNNDGENTTTLTIGQLPSHNHTYDRAFAATISVFAFSNNAANQPWGVGNTPTASANTGNGEAHNNRPSNLKVFKLIKT